VAAGAPLVEPVIDWSDGPLVTWPDKRAGRRRKGFHHLHHDAGAGDQSLVNRRLLGLGDLDLCHAFSRGIIGEFSRSFAFSFRPARVYVLDRNRNTTKTTSGSPEIALVNFPAVITKMMQMME
jgi:hypothetical protein